VSYSVAVTVDLRRYIQFLCITGAEKYVLHYSTGNSSGHQLVLVSELTLDVQPTPRLQHQDKHKYHI
jgi:hypothetical protein